MIKNNHTCSFVWYLSRNILNRSPWYFVRYLITDVLITAAVFLIFRNPKLSSVTYLSWVKLASVVFIVSAVLSLPVFSLENIKGLKGILKRIKGKKR